MKRGAALLLCSLAVLVLLMGVAGGAGAAPSAPIVQSGSAPGAVLKAFVKFRNFARNATGFDVQLGVAESGSGNSVNYDSGSGYPYSDTAPNPITFSYSGTVLSTIHPTSNGTSSGTLTFTPPAALGDLNYLQIEVVCRHPGESVALNNVMLGTDALGNFPATTCTNGFFSWNVTGVTLTSGFTVTGDLVLSSFTGLSGQETSKVVIRAGYLDPTAVTLAGVQAGTAMVAPWLAAVAALALLSGLFLLAARRGAVRAR